MQPIVFEKALAYESSGKFLGNIRQTVQELKRENPQLKDYTLADVVLRRSKKAVNVALLFQPKR